jgi:hypothetical protein
VPLLEVRLSELELHRGELAPQDGDEEVAAAAGRLKKRESIRSVSAFTSSSMASTIHAGVNTSPWSATRFFDLIKPISSFLFGWIGALDSGYCMAPRIIPSARRSSVHQRRYFVHSRGQSMKSTGLPCKIVSPFRVTNPDTGSPVFVSVAHLYPRAFQSSVAALVQSQFHR